MKRASSVVSHVSNILLVTSLLLGVIVLVVGHIPAPIFSQPADEPGRTIQTNIAGDQVYLPVIQKPTFQSETIIPLTGGVLAIPGYGFTLQVPSDYYGEPLRFVFVARSEPVIDGIHTTPYAFDLHAYTTEGIEVSQFNQTLSITQIYSEAAIGSINPADLYLAYQGEDGEWVALPSVVDVDGQKVTGTTEHFTPFALLANEDEEYQIGVGDDVPAYVTDAFVWAYNRNNDPPGTIGDPNSHTVPWQTNSWKQTFTNGGWIVYAPGVGAFYIPDDHVSVYEFDRLGFPKSDPFELPDDALYLDEHTNFTTEPIQLFEDGFIGFDTDDENGGGYMWAYYYPELLGAELNVQLIQIPDPDPPPGDPNATITVTEVTLSAGEVDLPHAYMSLAGIWYDTDGFGNGWLPNVGGSPQVWENLEPEGDFSFRLVAWADTPGFQGGQAGYLACDSYLKEIREQDYLETVSLEYNGTYFWGYDCEGIGGGDTTPPIIIHDPVADVWQNGKGWAIISAEVTDNVGVAWVRIVLNGVVCNDCIMSRADGNTYVAIVPLKLGKSTYHIEAADFSNNQARHPETGEHEIWSDMAFSYGHRPWMAFSDDPVNSGIGNFIYSFRDVGLTALGPDVIVERWFNHQSRYDGPFGIGWSFLYDMRLLFVDNYLFSGAQLRYADGRIVNFDSDGAGGFSVPETVHDVLIQEGSEYVLTMKDQTVYRFNTDGRLISIADKDGNTLTINYSGEEINNIVDASGRVIPFTYSDGYITNITIPDYGTVTYEYEDNRLTTVTDVEGRQAVYTYDDETGCMLTVTSPEGKPFLNEQTCDDDRRVTYQLGGTGYVNEFVYDDENRTTTIIDPYGNSVNHVYDEEYRVVGRRDELGQSETYTYNDDYLPLTITDRNGNTTTYTYDDNGNRLSATDALGHTTSYTYNNRNSITSRTDALGNITEYEYDAEGHLVREIDALGGITEYLYNEAGLLIQTINPLGHTTETTYNSLGLPETITDALGNVTIKIYDAAGQLISETDPLGNTTSYDYNSLGFVTSVTDPEGNTSTYEYDMDHNLVRETNADGYSKTYTYDDNNRLVAETDWVGNVTIYVYDDLARKVAEIDPLGYEITYEYDIAHRLIAQTDKRGATTTYTYDPYGNVLTETDALGNVTSYAYDALNRRVSVTYPCTCDERTEYTVYDALGRAIEQIDALGNSTYFEYDALGRENRRIDALGNETRRVYDAVGNMVEETDAFGNVTRYEYDALQRVVSVTNRLGHTVHQEYDAAGRTIAKIDARGNRTEYVYDGNGRLLQTIDALGNGTSNTYDGRGNRLSVTDALGRTIIFVYDANGNVISTTNGRGYTTTNTYNARNQLLSITDALGYIIHFTYDPAGARLSITDPRGYVQTTAYDILGRVITETDRNGNSTTFVYDVAGNLIEATDAMGGTVHYTYDANNNRLSETNPLGHTTEYRYDALNRQVEVLDALGGTTVYVYDPLGRLVELIDANGNSTIIAYDAEGQQIATTDALGHTSYNVYDPAGNLISSTDRNGNTTTYQYDALNRQIEMVNALGHTGAIGYDAVGNVISRTNFRGYQTQLEYDENNNLITMMDALGGITSYAYDELDRLVSETDANGHTTTYSYDSVRNLLSKTLPEGQVSSYTYDGENNQLTFTNGRGFTTLYEYDALNRPILETDPLRHSTTTVYDAIGQIVQAIDANGNGIVYGYDALGRLITVIDALGHTTTYTYDAVGNRLTKTDANGHTTTFVYNPVNRLINETNPIGSTWVYIYDPEGNLIESMDANGQTTWYEFDALHQMIAMRFANSAQDVTYAYDENGNLVQMVDPVGTTTLVYDALDREVGKTDVYGYTTLNEYDAVGNRTALTYPDGSRVTYFYNGNDWLIIMVDPRGGQTGYSYEDDGQVRTIDQPNDTWTSNVYDDAGRLVRLFNGTGYHGGIITSYDYALDAVGNRLQIVERYTQGQVRTNVKSYTYNARYELLEAVEVYEGPPAYTVTTSYTYDPAGNRLSMTTDRDTGSGPQPDPETTNYSYDAANRMLSAGSMSFTYDANGNRLTKATTATPPSQSRLETYAYDEQNRLVLYARIRTQNGQVEQRVYSVYDGLGRRVNKGTQESSGVVKWTRYSLDGLSYDQLAEYPQVGPPRTTELYRGLDNRLISMDEIQGGGQGSQYWFAHDGLESVAATTKQNGQGTHEFFYDPYGQLIDENGHWEDSSSWTDPHNHYLLSGKEWDEESRLYYFGARFYDAQVGVWITPDPLRGEARVPITLHPYFRLGYQPPNQADNANEPASLHRYLYVQNNPLNRIDLYGYSGCGPYAKCNDSLVVNAAIALLFGGTFRDGNREIKLDLIYFLDEVIDIDFPDKAFNSLEEKVEKYVQFEVAFGYEARTKETPNLETGQLEVCREVSPYVRGYIGAEIPIPGYHLDLGWGELGFKGGFGVEGKLAGSLKGCAPILASQVDLKQGYLTHGKIEASLELSAYLKGVLGVGNEDIGVEGSVSAGIKGGLEWPLLDCSRNAYNHRFDCDNNPKEELFLKWFYEWSVEGRIGFIGYSRYGGDDGDLWRGQIQLPLPTLSSLFK